MPSIPRSLPNWATPAWSLRYEYVRDSRVADRGIPSAFAGIASPIRRDRPEAFVTHSSASAISTIPISEAHVLRFRSESRSSENLTFKTQALYGDYDKSYSNVFAATAIGGTAAAPTLNRSLYRSNQATDVYWSGQSGMARIHRPLRTSALVRRRNNRPEPRNERINGFFSPTVL